MGIFDNKRESDEMHTFRMSANSDLSVDEIRKHKEIEFELMGIQSSPGKARMNFEKWDKREYEQKLNQVLNECGPESGKLFLESADFNSCVTSIAINNTSPFEAMFILAKRNAELSEIIRKKIELF